MFEIESSSVSSVQLIQSQIKKRKPVRKIKKHIYVYKLMYTNNLYLPYNVSNVVREKNQQTKTKI